MAMLGAIFMLFGIAWIIWFLRMHRRAVAQAQAAQSWPTTRGEILESRIAVSESTDSDGNTTCTYSPVLRYRSSVGERDFEGKRLRFGVESSGSEGTIKAWLIPYREGQRPTVHYHPADPADSVLETVKPSNAYIVASLVGGGAFMLIGLVAAFLPGD